MTFISNVKKAVGLSRVLLVLAVVAAALSLGAGSANAQASRTWVSGVGDDAFPCSREAPCKTFAGAISKTAAGGEINCLDPGGFGALTITKAITVSCEAGTAGVLVAGTNGIVVQAGASDKVTLRGLDFNGLSQSGTPGINGIRFLSGAALLVDHCKIYDFSTNGIDIALAAPATATVRDTVISDVGGAGIRVTSSAGGGSLNAEHVNISRYGTNGVEAATGGLAAVSNSVVLGGGNGVAATSGGAIMSSTGSVLAGNNNGAAATIAGAIIALDNNFVFANNTAISAVPGSTFQSSSTNRLSQNGSPGANSNSAMTFR
jgi:hypothetical protein